MKAIAAIKKFFDNPPLTMEEIKAIPHDDRQELGKLICDEIGEDFEPTEKK